MNISEIIQPPSDPAQLAEIKAEQLSGSGFYIDEKDERILAELDHAANQLDFLDSSYFINANSALIIPKSWDRNQRVTYSRLGDILFEGKLTCYSRVSIGRLIGQGAVRALCLSFDKAMLISYFDEIAEEDMLHVPVLAINDITQVE
jgi:hypothetical protein